VVLFLGSAGLYLRTLCPTIFTGDSPTFSTSAFCLGVAHPPGYPLYALLARLFCLLPLGDVGFRTNLAVAVMGAGAVAVTYYCARTLGLNRIWAAFAAVILACSRVFWDQALAAEVYSLHAMMVTLVLLVLFSRQPMKRKVPLLAFLMGLAMANHFMSVFLFVISAIWLYGAPCGIFKIPPAKLKRIPAKFKGIPAELKGIPAKQWCSMVLLLMLGVSCYLYLPLRAVRHPGVNWGDTSTVENFVRHVRREQYRELEFGEPFSLSTKAQFLLHFLRELGAQFGWILVIPGILGVCLLWNSHFRECLSLLVLFALNSIGLIVMLNFPFDEVKRFVVTVYYIPCYIIFALFIAVGMQRIMSAGKFAGKFRKAAAWILLVAAAVSLVAWNYPKIDKRLHSLARRYGMDQLRCMDRNAVAILYGDGSCFPVRYLQEVCGYRRDVVVVRRNRLLNPQSLNWYFDELTRHYGKRIGLQPLPEFLRYQGPDDLDVALRRMEIILNHCRLRYPVYALGNEVLDRPLQYRVTGPGVVELNKQPGAVRNRFFIHGLLERLLVSGGPGPAHLLQAGYRFWDRVLSWRHSPVVHQDNFLEREILMNYAKTATNFGSLLFANGRVDDATRVYRQVYRLVPAYGTSMHNLGHLYHQQKLFSKAEEAYRLALKADPDLVQTMNNLGVILQYVKGDFDGARELFKRVVTTAPGSPTAGMAIKNLRELDQLQKK